MRSQVATSDFGCNNLTEAPYAVAKLAWAFQPTGHNYVRGEKAADLEGCQLKGDPVRRMHGGLHAPPALSSGTCSY